MCLPAFIIKVKSFVAGIPEKVLGDDSSIAFPRRSVGTRSFLIIITDRIQTIFQNKV